MSEHVVQQQPVRNIPFWKATAFFLAWVFLLGSTGMFIGNRYFWTGVDFAQIQREIAYYRQLVEMEPDQPEHRVALGFNLHRLGDTQAALHQYQTAIEMDEGLFDAYLNRGYVYTELGYWDDALADFEMCVELSPNDYKGWMNLGIVYRELDMIDASHEALAVAQELRPASTDILYQAALTAEREGDMEAVIHYLERALAFDPKYQDALNLYKKVTQ